MLIRRIILEDFGLFRGRNELNLAPRSRGRQHRPVVLIGGKNGSGKTTLLDALRLCLFGPLSLGSRVSTREYETYLADRIHRNDDTLFQPKKSSVSVEFEYAQAGVVTCYRVERRWELLEKGIRSTLIVERDGKLLDELDRDHADEFLRDLIPPGVAQLFFFDGEKIQQLADGDQDHVALADAVRGLIGLDHVERLRGDLRIFAGRLQDLPSTGPLRDQVAALVRELEALHERGLALQRQHDENQSRLDRTLQDIAREKQRLAQAGGNYAKKRDNLEAEKSQLTIAITSIEDEIRSLSSDLMPFMLAAGLCRQLQSQLRSEREVIQWTMQSASLRNRVTELKNDIDAILFPPKQSHAIPRPACSALRQRVVGMLDGLVEPPADLPKVPVIHRLSEEARDQVIAAANQVTDELPKQVTGIQKRLEKATRRLREVENALGRIPKDDVVRPTMERLETLHVQLGSAQADLSRIAVELSEFENKRGDVERQKQRAEVKLNDLSLSGDRGLLVSKVQNSLNDFANALTTAKVQELRDAVVHCFARLWRKGDVVRRIDFDPADMRVMLFDRHDREIPKQRLSAGEKQIYAISLLWALAQVSGRPLPVVIDTPLGRLDRDHRSHLVTRYFPHASHQVVILSTDTEIDQAYFQELAPMMSHAYHLRYDEANACCVVEDGYFVNELIKEASNATK